MTQYRLGEHSLASTDKHGLQEKTDCACCTQQGGNQAALSFYTSCQLYQDITDTYFSEIPNTQKDFENTTNEKKRPYLQGKMQQRANAAARSVSCCDRKRLSYGREAASRQ